MKKLFRYERNKYHYFESIEDGGEPEYKLKLRELFIIRETACGFWIIDDKEARKRWVSSTGKKRFAHESQKEALEAFVHRSRHAMSYARTHYENAQGYFIRAKLLLSESKF